MVGGFLRAVLYRVVFMVLRSMVEERGCIAYLVCVLVIRIPAIVVYNSRWLYGSLRKSSSLYSGPSA